MFYLVPVSELDRNLTIVTQYVLQPGLGVVHQPVGDPLREARLRVRPLLHFEIKHHGLNGYALQKHL